jgi:hypothetical protein
MCSVILFMLGQTVDNRVPLLLFTYFSPLTVTLPNLSVFLRPLYLLVSPETCVAAIENDPKVSQPINPLLEKISPLC